MSICCMCGKEFDEIRILKLSQKKLELKTCEECRNKRKEYFAVREKKGICKTCGKQLNNSNHTLCDECLKNHRNTQKKIQNIAKAKSICCSCYTRKPKENSNLCEFCLDYYRSKIKKLKDNRKSNNLCIYCGIRPSVKNGQKCIICKEILNKLSKFYYHPNIGVDRFNNLSIGDRFLFNKKAINILNQKYYDLNLEEDNYGIILNIKKFANKYFYISCDIGEFFIDTTKEIIRSKDTKAYIIEVINKKKRTNEDIVKEVNEKYGITKIN